MPLPALDLLDDDPLGLFDDIKPKKKRNKRSRKKLSSIYDELDESKENVIGDTEGQLNSSNTYFKESRRTIPVKSVTFTDENINIPNSERPSNSDSNEYKSHAPDQSTSFHSLSHDVDDDHLVTLQAPINHHPVDTMNSLVPKEQHNDNGNAGNLSVLLANLEVGNSNHTEDEEHDKFSRECVANQNDEVTKVNDLSPRLEKEQTRKSDVSETLEFLEANEDPQSGKNECDNTNAVVLNTDEDKKLPQPRKRSTELNVVRCSSGPMPRKKRSNSARGDVVALSAQLNNTQIQTVLYNSREFNEHRANSGTRDIVISPYRTVRAAPIVGRPQSCHALSRTGIASPDIMDNGDFGAETNAATLRMIAYKNWYRKHAHNAQISRIDSLKQDAVDVRRQHEHMDRSKSNEQAFEAWRAQKRAYFREQLRQKRIQEEERQKKLEESQERKLSSSKESQDHAFDMWKSRKDSVLKKQHRDSQHRERMLRETQAQMEAEKRAQSEQAFEVWKARKEAQAREELLNRRRKQSEEERRRDEEARLKSEKAAEAYYQWEMRKVSSVENLRQSLSRESILDRFPWRPPSARPSLGR